MSYDRLIDQICPHMVQEEPLYIQYDRQTIKPQRPVAATSSVKVRLNGAFTVPSSGLYTAARAVGTILEPFTVLTGVNDTLIMRVGSGAAQTITIPSSTGLTAAKLAGVLSAQASNVIFESRAGYMSLRTASQGPNATVTLLAGSTLAPTLGLAINRVWQGLVVAPGWSVVSDPTSLPQRPNRWIVFDEPLKSFQDYVEVSYSTVYQECRRCGGMGYENDWVYGQLGDVAEVIDENLLLQEITKLMYTVRGSNTFNLWYGTGLTTLVGSKISMMSLLQNMIVSDVQQAFTRWQSVKKQQEEVVGQYVSDREYPYRLISVNVYPSNQDPTVVYVDITVMNRSMQPITLTRGILLPVGVLSLNAGTIQGSANKFILTG